MDQLLIKMMLRQFGKFYCSAKEIMQHTTYPVLNLKKELIKMHSNEILKKPTSLTKKMCFSKMVKQLCKKTLILVINSSANKDRRDKKTV